MLFCLEFTLQNSDSKCIDPSKKAQLKKLYDELLQTIDRTKDQTKAHHHDHTCRYIQKLTKREKDILSQLLNGHTYQDISTTIQISANTVKAHVKKIFQKFHVNSRTELLVMFLKEDLHIHDAIDNND